MAPKDLRGKVAIVGASESDEMGKLPDKSVLTLHAESIRNALDDAGLKLSDVDGLFMAGGSPETTVNDLCEYLGVMPRYADSTIVGGCSFIMHVEHAMLALSAGVINTAVISHGESGRSRMGLPGFADESATHNGQFEDPFGTSARRLPSRYPSPGTCTSTARRGSSWRRCRWRRGSGR